MGKAMGLSSPELWGGQPVPSPGDLSKPESEPRPPALQVLQESHQTELNRIPVFVGHKLTVAQ